MGRFIVRLQQKPEAWSDIIGRMWAQLENPEEALDGDFVSGSFSWLTKNQGYECDCKAGFVWNQEDTICEKDESHQKHCDPVTLKPCQLPGAKSCRINECVELFPYEVKSKHKTEFVLYADKVIIQLGQRIHLTRAWVRR